MSFVAAARSRPAVFRAEVDTESIFQNHCFREV